MIEKYYKYKLNNKNSIIFIDVGSFYETLDNDALIINKIFNYKITLFSSLLKVGFPKSKIDDIKEKLNELKINYYVINQEEIKEFLDNKYNEYTFDNQVVYYKLMKINSITKKLSSIDIEKISIEALDEIDKLII